MNKGKEDLKKLAEEGIRKKAELEIELKRKSLSEDNDLVTSWKNNMLENYLNYSAECFEGNDLHDFLNAVVRTANKLNALKLEQTIKNDEKDQQ